MRGGTVEGAESARAPLVAPVVSTVAVMVVDATLRCGAPVVLLLLVVELADAPIQMLTQHVVYGDQRRVRAPQRRVVGREYPDQCAVLFGGGGHAPALEGINVPRRSPS